MSWSATRADAHPALVMFAHCRNAARAAAHRIKSDSSKRGRRPALRWPDSPRAAASDAKPSPAAKWETQAWISTFRRRRIASPIRPRRSPTTTRLKPTSRSRPPSSGTARAGIKRRSRGTARRSPPPTRWRWPNSPIVIRPSCRPTARAASASTRSNSTRAGTSCWPCCAARACMRCPSPSRAPARWPRAAPATSCTPSSNRARCAR